MGDAEMGDGILELDITEEGLAVQEEIAEEANCDYIKMDFTIESPEGRNELVKKIIANTPPERLTNTYLEKLADYIIFALDKEEKKQKKILTDSRMVTINKRETSFEGLVGKMENGEDGIYNMIANDKNIIFQPKAPITEEDVESIPGMRELREAIASTEEKAKNARGKKAYLLKKQVIEMRQDQYVLKSAYVKPVRANNIIKSIAQANLEEHVTIDKKTGEPVSDGLISLFNPKDVSSLLCNYSKLKEDTWDKLNCDMRWMLLDLEKVVDEALADYPFYFDLVVYKIDGKSNALIQELLYEDYGIRNSVEYLSSLWRNKIPKMIAEQAVKDYLEWYYTYKEEGYFKKCSRCGQTKLGHNLFFSKNKTSKDGFYSICKECRNKKTKEPQMIPVSACEEKR